MSVAEAVELRVGRDTAGNKAPGSARLVFHLRAQGRGPPCDATLPLAEQDLRTLEAVAKGLPGGGFKECLISGGHATVSMGAEDLEDRLFTLKDAATVAFLELDALRTCLQGLCMAPAIWELVVRLARAAQEAAPGQGAVAVRQALGQATHGRFSPASALPPDTRIATPRGLFSRRLLSQLAHHSSPAPVVVRG